MVGTQLAAARGPEGEGCEEGVIVETLFPGLGGSLFSLEPYVFLSLSINVLPCHDITEIILERHNSL